MNCPPENTAKSFCGCIIEHENLFDCESLKSKMNLHCPQIYSKIVQMTLCEKYTIHK